MCFFQFFFFLRNLLLFLRMNSHADEESYKSHVLSNRARLAGWLADCSLVVNCVLSYSNWNTNTEAYFECSEKHVYWRFFFRQRIFPLIFCCFSSRCEIIFRQLLLLYFKYTRFQMLHNSCKSFGVFHLL